MKYVRMGSTGTQVSRICLGCMSFGGMADWTLNEDTSLPIVQKAWEAGINFFDTADIYSRGQSEEILGRSLKTLGVRRDEAVIATKVFNPMGRGPNRGGLSRKHITQSIDASLKRLGVDYIDLYQIHRFDYDTPIEETIEALDDVVKAGKALYLGASSMFAYQFSKYLHRADEMGRSRFAMMQNHYNLAYREEEREMNPLCLEEGVGLIPWSPLAGGFLAGNREAGTTRSQSNMGRGRYQRPEDQAVIERTEEGCIRSAERRRPRWRSPGCCRSTSGDRPDHRRHQAAPHGRPGEGGGEPAQRRGSRDAGGALRRAGGCGTGRPERHGGPGHPSGGAAARRLEQVEIWCRRGPGPLPFPLREGVGGWGVGVIFEATPLGANLPAGRLHPIPQPLPARGRGVLRGL